MDKKRIFDTEVCGEQNAKALEAVVDSFRAQVIERRLQLAALTPAQKSVALSKLIETLRDEHCGSSFARRR